MTHPYSEWCLCEECASMALLFLPDCHPYERRYLTPEHLATLTPAPEATTTEALRAIEPNPHRSCNRVVNGQCMFTNDTCTPTCHLDW